MDGWMPGWFSREVFGLDGENRWIGELAGVIDARINKKSERPLFLDFGTVGKNGSLKTATFPKAIAEGDYLVLDGFKRDSGSTRVLVAWVEDEAVVVGKVSGT